MSLLRALPASDTYTCVGAGHLSSAFAVSDLAAASVAAVGQELAGLMTDQGMVPSTPEISVDRRLASLWFDHSLHPLGWEMPDLWDPIAGNYETADGWIRLHTNLPQHRLAALSVLGCGPTRADVTTAVSKLAASALEQAVVEAGGAAACLRSRADWIAHPQGSAVAQEPLIDWSATRPVILRDRPGASPDRPLHGLRVLDLTRVLAGPVGTRTLAAFGADVLRIDPPGWDEPGVIPEVTPGKRCASLDLKSDAGLTALCALLEQADVLVHGYRNGALDALGLTRQARRAVSPNCVEVCLNAYGWTGPWRDRRGFDSLVQMSSGIADAGSVWAAAAVPTPLPVQALDHATGFLLAASVLSALRQAVQTGRTADARLSLARTAETLVTLPVQDSNEVIRTPQADDYAHPPEQTGWGMAHRLKPPLTVGPARMRWDIGAGPVGRHPPVWPGLNTP